MMALTDEQTSVIDDFVIHDRNVVLRANYGSGKTTVVLQIVNDVHASGGCALCLVYNASMKYEMRAKAELHSKHTIHTIHSAAQFIFEGVCGSNDDGIETSLSAPVSTDGHDLVSRITHIIVDEAQDIKPIFYDFISMLVTTVTSITDRKPSLLLVGDAMQEVNRWNGSDARFLTMAPELQYGAPTDVWSERALTKTFRCPPEVVTCNNAMTGLQVVSDKPYGGDKPCLKICDIWDRSPDNEGYRQIIVWLEQGFTPSDILVLVPSLKTSAPSRVLQGLLSGSGISSYQPMRDDTEGGLDRNLYLNKVRFCTFHACKGMEAACVLVLCFDKQCGWLSEGYENVTPPPYHVAMTRSSSRLTLLHGHRAPPLPCIKEMFVGGLIENHFDVSGQLHDGELRDETSNSGKVYNVTDMVDGYICTKSISAAMASFNFDVFGQTTMKDESGQPIYPETAPSTVSGIAHTDSIEDVSCLNGIIAELIAACTLELPFNSIPALKSLMSPGECIKFKPDDLSFERRSDMRFEYAHYKKGGNMDLKTATLASLVHKFKTDGFTTLLAQIKDGVWWTDSQRESVQDSLLNMLRRLGGCNRPDVLWSTDVPCETSVCGLDVKGRIDFMAQGFLIETKYVNELSNVHMAQLVMYSKAKNPPPGTSCCLLNLRSGEYWYYSYDSVSVDRFCSMMQLKQPEVRLSDEAFLLKYGARDSM
jgi:hypothetical protein